MKRLIPFLFIAIPVAAEQSYSPYVDRDYPKNVYWGDTHLHTYLSGDAYALGTTITPDQAYRFARGETIRATGGDEVRLRRPLDFMMVADHAKYLGVLPALMAGDQRLLASEHGRRFAKVLAERPVLPDVLRAKTLEEYNDLSNSLTQAKAGRAGDYGIDQIFKREVWREVVAAAERYNDPGNFTTFAGYEYSSNPPMLHRNVLYAGGPSATLKTLPYSKFDSTNPEDLWAYLDAYREMTGSDVISIPHNSNLSRGNMFMTVTYEGKAISPDYARIRSSIEPIIEVTQIKGDSEAHPLISPDDEFADHETWGTLTLPPKQTTTKSDAKSKQKTSADNKGDSKQKAPAAKKPASASKDVARASYARSALQTGLDIEASVGTLPSVGSTVNLKNASYRNTVGSPELSVVWTDPDFDASEAAVYYVRVLQIPTPRWTTYDAKFYGLKEIQQNPPAVLQERAYSSPIWYTPR